ncbi:restriction endonuclease subunit M, partial [Escherichia coli]|nr:restriction endonuclease subunit M [Escherichia coli]
PADRMAHSKKSLEAFPVLKQCIDFDTRMQLSELMFKNDGDNKWSCWTSLGSLAERKSSSVAADTLRFLGATVTKYDVTFSYDPCEVIRYIGQIGEMPDIVSHQFYPSS